MCSARYWRAGASQPAGSDVSRYIGIYTRRMHGIGGERERSNYIEKECS